MVIGPFSPRIQGSDGAAAPSSAGRLSNIDALRGSAAVAVAVSHIYQQFYAEQFGPVLHKILSYAGGWGVALFFVLSGFCIHLPHAERKRFAAKVGGGDRQAKHRGFRDPALFADHPSLLAFSWSFTGVGRDRDNKYIEWIDLLGRRTRSHLGHSRLFSKLLVEHQLRFLDDWARDSFLYFVYLLREPRI
jgi:hypothetical protein